MAVAWEYGRENFDLFLKFFPLLWKRDKKRYKKTKKPFHTIHSYGLSQIFLNFWESPHWPKKPFLIGVKGSFYRENCFDDTTQGPIHAVS